MDVQAEAKIPNPTVLCSALGECNAMAMVIQLWKRVFYYTWLLVAPVSVTSLMNNGKHILNTELYRNNPRNNPGNDLCVG